MNHVNFCVGVSFAMIAAGSADSSIRGIVVDVSDPRSMNTMCFNVVSNANVSVYMVAAS